MENKQQQKEKKEKKRQVFPDCQKRFPIMLFVLFYCYSCRFINVTKHKFDIYVRYYKP